MPEGFFSASEHSNKKALPLLAQCGACGLHKRCASPKMPISGKGRRGILIIAEAPGESEDERGYQLCDAGGKHLESVLADCGVVMRRDCWLTSAVICRPSDGDNDRTPTDAEVDYCRPNLVRTVRELNPTTVLLLGGVAVRSLIGAHWKEDVGPISRWVGWRVPHQKLNAWLCPTYHPSHCLRGDRDAPAVSLHFARHVAAAVESTERPWSTPPEWVKQVQRVYDPDEAVPHIREFVRRGNWCAFDYETNRVKPDGDGAKIVCCSISDGLFTIAYPWHGAAIKATERFLQSDTPKVGANIKFEQRWTLARLGVQVNNWVHDTMVTAHALDSRPGITGLKFQAFVNFGQESYDDAVAPFFKSAGSNVNNRVHEVSLSELLKYCGLDALLEWKLAMRQRKQIEALAREQSS